MTDRMQKIAKRPSLPTVDGTLDKFIEGAQAELHAHDVSYFDPESREERMRKEIDELKRQLAATEERATKTPEVARQRWGSLVVAFALGEHACSAHLHTLRGEALT